MERRKGTNIVIRDYMLCDSVTIRKRRHVTTNAAAALAHIDIFWSSLHQVTIRFALCYIHLFHLCHSDSHRRHVQSRFHILRNNLMNCRRQKRQKIYFGYATIMNLKIAAVLRPDLTMTYF